MYADTILGLNENLSVSNGLWIEIHEGFLDVVWTREDSFSRHPICLATHENIINVKQYLHIDTISVEYLNLIKNKLAPKEGLISNFFKDDLIW